MFKQNIACMNITDKKSILDNNKSCITNEQLLFIEFSYLNLYRSVRQYFIKETPYNLFW